ncbi:hypothetical protein D7X98_08080 [bacterium 1XD8-76]|nr:hypothetical protein D7X98_08080 [bacterium 1XD8-76]
MEILKKQKKILTAFCFFLAFMFACTLISRAVYASKLPQVSVDTPRRMAIGHKVDAEGIVHQGREYAVNVLSGLRVRTVYAHVGDKVTTDTLLFEIDMEDLEEQVRQKELAVKKLQLQIGDQEKNRALQEDKDELENIRAQEDYEKTAQEEQTKIDRAELEKKTRERDLRELENNPVQVTSEEDRKAAQEKYEAWAKEAERLKSAMENAKQEWEAAQGKVKELEAGAAAEVSEAEEDAAPAEDSALRTAKDAETEAKKKYDDAKAAYDEYRKTPVAKPDYSAEDAARDAWEKEKRSLEDAANAAALEENDAKAAKEKAMESAGRNLEDTEAEKASDSSLEINRLELSALQSELSAYRKVLEAQGQIFPEADGIVTRIQVNPGERVPDGAAVVYADLSSPMQFTVSLTKDQKKYVNQGDLAKLSLGNGKGEEYQVDYIAENEANPELYEARILLEEGVGTIGESGKFEVEAQSETFSCCIPLAALHEDANHRKFVYVVSERSGILGMELAAEAVYVKVLDQNDSYAAIEEGVIDSETELILSSTEAIEDRDVIRYKE